MTMATMTVSQELAPSPNGRSVSKVEKFGWIIVDKRGVAMDIPKCSLHVDKSYQRDALGSSKILRIAREWSWIACGRLIVGIRPDGSYVVIDGQHRKLAADKRSDIADLPCEVFEVLGPSQEA